MGEATAILDSFTRLGELDEAWRERAAGTRFEAVRRAAPRLRERIGASGKAIAVRTFDSAMLPYPTAFAFGGAAISPLPYVTMMNRMQLVQFVDGHGTPRTLLFNPTDAERSATTPFFQKVQDGVGEALGARLRKLLLKPTAADHLRSVGVAPASVDYVAFDHLHTQDLRRILGAGAEVGQFPRAKLLVWRPELELFARLHPLQRPWFIERGIEGVASNRIVAFEDGDWLLGAGVALVRTPGHTVGNWSLVLGSQRGLWVVSENGVSCDNYAPEASAIRGLARHAKKWEQEVLLNSNTLEMRNEQYTSMILEKTLADRVPDRPEFVQHFASSELVASPISLGLGPTYAHRVIAFGEVRRSQRAAVAESAAAG
jgi:hypothetical protein